MGGRLGYSSVKAVKTQNGATDNVTFKNNVTLTYGKLEGAIFKWSIVWAEYHRVPKHDVVVARSAADASRRILLKNFIASNIRLETVNHPFKLPAAV